MKKQTFSTLFLVKDSTRLKNGETPILMRLTLSGQRAEIQLKRRINPKNWDQAKEKAKGNGSISIEINNYLDSIPSRIYTILREIEDEGFPLTYGTLNSIFSDY